MAMLWKFAKYVHRAALWVATSLILLILKTAADNLFAASPIWADQSMYYPHVVPGSICYRSAPSYS